MRKWVVDLLINKIIKEKGIDYLFNFSKLNFKNTMKGKEINEEINEAIKIKDNRFVLKGNVDSGYIMFTKGKWEILIDSNIEFAK